MRRQPSRRELRKMMLWGLWPNDTVVEFENSINAAMKNLRLALADSARYVETLARRGYRWLVPVTWVEEKADSPSAPTELHPEF